MISSHNARRHLLAASLGLALVLPAAAEDAHHPPGAAPPPPAATAPTAPAPAARGMGMMGQGMMGQGSGMSMMSMMGMGEAGRLERVNGHLAFLEAELKISEAQRPLWAAFAQAVRSSAEKHNTMASMASGPDATPVDRLAHQEHALAQRLDGVRAIKTALAPLYAALSEAQKKTFAELLPMRMMM
jgi:predicted lipid-binding transport protein (Tim44 family)